MIHRRAFLTGLAAVAATPVLPTLQAMARLWPHQEAAMELARRGYLMHWNCRCVASWECTDEIENGR